MTELSEVKEFFARAYSLEHTHRYSMLPVIKQESVASHSYFVALGVLLLHDTYEFDLEKALCMAICHDMGEIGVSDVNHVVKKKYPKIAQALKEAELEEIKTFPASVRKWIERYSNSETQSVEGDIVHYADTIQVYQYASSEVELGNAGYMSYVYANSIERMKQHEQRLRPFLRGEHA